MPETKQLVMELDDRPRKPGGPSRRKSWEMFDRIAHRYDLLNHVLSLGQDLTWRNRVAAYLPAGPELAVLDLATGTGDQLLSLFARCPRVKSGVGLDLAGRMLDRAREKVASRDLGQAITLQAGDAADIPFENQRFDVVTISFGIRNVADVSAALKEMLRVLRPGGRALILEFSLPGPRWLRAPYLFYFRHILPRIGGWISGDASAYRYLNETVETFPCGENFCDLFRDAGFQGVAYHPLTFGVATIYRGDKPGVLPTAGNMSG